jgi:hypothetical protein
MFWIVPARNNGVNGNTSNIGGLISTLNTEQIMKTLLLIGALALASSGAFAQSSQGEAGANVGSERAPAANMSNSEKSGGMREGVTTGMGTGKTGGPNGAPNAPAKTTTGPGPQGAPASDAESPAK